MTMHDISLKPRGKEGVITPNSPLELAGTVKTYRYLDEDETKAQEAKAAKSKPKSKSKGGK
jgi:type IV pilus assembly protein PilO